MNTDDHTQIPTFSLGLTMAGAVSAGCYTAGAMDYLFEMLELWEQAKAKKIPGINQNEVPGHKVVIDAMGGASAGGMVTIMSAIYALEGEVNPVREVSKDPQERFNILYDSWVYLDDGNGHTFEQLWDTDDLDGEQKLISLFNSKFIDSIAAKAFTFDGERNIGDQLFHMRPYVSKSLEMLLSHSMLRGIPLEVDFNSAIDPNHDSKHTTYEHLMISHFKFSVQDKDFPEGYLQLNPYDKDTAEYMKSSTISTGAFPLGLKYRSLNYLNKTYYKNVIKRIVYAEFGNEKLDEADLIDLKSLPEDFKTLVVDGGAINNEPYSEVLSILRFRNAPPKVDVCANNPQPEAPQFKNYGLVMIDPFPDRAVKDARYTEADDLLGVIPNILGMLQNQSKVKRREMISDFKGEYRGEIYPRKKGVDGKLEEYPIACGSFFAFGGFLDINFRKHDFFLGRDNARNFYRYFFSLPYYEGQPEKNHPIHRNWSYEARERFKIPTPEKKTAEQLSKMTQKEQDFEKEREAISYYLPIVPDMNMILNDEQSGATRNRYTIRERPTYDPSALMNLDAKMVKRIGMMLEKVKDKYTNAEKPVQPKKTEAEVQREKEAIALVDSWMNKYYSKELFGRLRPWIAKMVFAVSKRGISKMIAKAMIKMILTDLAKRGLLQKVPKK